ncbi:zeta toxin family protein [Streptomyces sp. NPDC006335]|uniref:zeta toxin family protein n=1 Tax=Streptomyces sp. NPDC006335 TaxID=3156895 RepID=UPI0033BB7074
MESIFEQRIRPDYDPVVSREDPRLVCLAAQPGAGKTDNRHLVSSGREATRICGDDFKIAHPRYLELLAADPRTAGERIRPVYQEWQRRMESLVRDLRGDVVIELSPGPDRKFLDDAALYRAAGYRVELVVLAVRQADSRQGISLRYARALTSPQARFTSVAGHDVCFTALAEVLAAVERESAVHSLKVVRRDGTVLHHSERDAAGHLGRGAVEALRREWERPYTRDEAEVFLENQEELHRTLPEYGAEWDDIAALAGRLMPLSLN